jgi:hypothetical protein
MLLLLAVAAARAKRAVVGVALAVLVVGSFMFALWQSIESPPVAYFSTFTRGWELAFGGLLAVAAPLFARMPTALRAVLAWVGLAGIVAALLLVDSTMAFPGPWAAPAVLATGAVIVAGIGGRQPWLFPLENPVSGFLGDISYSLYLWHFPVLVFALLLLPEQSLTVTIVILSLTLAVSLVSYFLIEQPLHRSPWLRGRELLQDAATEVDSGPASADLVKEQALPGAAVIARRPPAVIRPAAISDRERARALAAEAARSKARAEAAPVGTTPRAHRAPVDATAAPDLREARRTAWQEWRERFGAQFVLSGLGLVILVAVVAVTVQVSLKGEGPLAIAVPQDVPMAGIVGPAHPETGDTGEDAEAVENPEVELQAELWAAASATEWPTNLSPSMDAAISETSSRNPAKDCFAVGGAPDFGRCTWGSDAAPNHLYLVGDSTALAYAPAFKQIAESSGGQWNVTAVGLYGCRFTDVLVKNDGSGVMDSCPQRKADVAAQIANDSPQLVVVSNAYALGNTADGHPLTVNDLVASTLSQAGRFGVPGQVVYLAPPPLGASLGACYSPVKSPQDCSVGVDQTWNDFQASFEAAVSGSGDHVVSSLGFTCSEGYCPAFAGTLPTRYDQVHMTPEYAVRVASSIRWEFAVEGLM